MKRFLNLIVYILTIHVSALLIAGLFRLVLFMAHPKFLGGNYL